MLPEDLCTKTQCMNDLVNDQHCTIRSTKFRVSIQRGAAAPRGYLQFRKSDLHVVYTWSFFHTQGIHFGLIETVRAEVQCILQCSMGSATFSCPACSHVQLPQTATSQVIKVRAIDSVLNDRHCLDSIIHAC